MNKQELFEKISDLDEITIRVPTNTGLAEVNYLRKPEVLELIEQLDEPKKPVIPQFVADWIDECKRDKKSLYYALESRDEVNFWLERDEKIRENEDTFARAWLDGYEIEKEKMYTVEIPNPNSAGGKLVLFKQQSTGRLILDMLNPNINKPKYLQLTEAEVKQDFEWAWPWAVPVEEN